jgi:hypothetical protein
VKAAFSQLVEIVAECDDCGWSCEERNAQGLASQHAERTGHLVQVTVTRHYEYAPPGRWSMRPAEAKERFESTTEEGE